MPGLCARKFPTVQAGALYEPISVYAFCSIERANFTPSRGELPKSSGVTETTSAAFAFLPFLANSLIPFVTTEFFSLCDGTTIPPGHIQNV